MFLSDWVCVLVLLQRVQQVLPVVGLRVVGHQLLERLRRAVRVVYLHAGAHDELQRLILRSASGLDVRFDNRLEELQGALVVALQVVRLADNDVDLLVAIATLDGAVAELDGLVVVLQLVVDLRGRLDDAGQLCCSVKPSLAWASKAFSAD